MKKKTKKTEREREREREREKRKIMHQRVGVWEPYEGWWTEQRRRRSRKRKKRRRRKKVWEGRLGIDFRISCVWIFRAARSPRIGHLQNRAVVPECSAIV